MISWTTYADRQPPVLGAYEWRVPSRSCKGLVVRTLSLFRTRWAGYQNVDSPEFDYWDGYSISVPPETQWRPNQTGVSLKYNQQKLICVEGVDLDPCPFCKSVPTLNGHADADGFVELHGDAHTIEKWWLKCCEWAASPIYSDPRNLALVRRTALGGNS